MSKTYQNRRARRLISEYCQKHNIIACEMKLPDCMGQAHAPAHRHKRRHYKTAAQMADRSEWLAACTSCHHKTEYNRELNKKVFNEANPSRTTRS